MTRISAIRSSLLCIVSMGCCLATASAQVVRIAPIVKQTPTPDADARFPGAVPPASDARVNSGATFYTEIWATNVGVPLDGLACVYVDLFYDRTDLVDTVGLVESSPLFPIDAVTTTFDDLAGLVDNAGGCQFIPIINFLGVGEWVLVKRIPMTPVGVGGPVTLSLTDANDPVAGTSIIGQGLPLTPADLDLLPQTFVIGECITAADCDDANLCTDDTCVANLCVHTNNIAPCDDGNLCTTGDVCAAGACAGTPVDCTVLNDQCNVGVCNAGTGICEAQPANEGGACSDGNACTTGDTCSLGTCVGGAPPNCDDGNVCTDDSCVPATGCVNTNNVAPCDDLNACTTGDTCAAGICVGGAPPNCNDGNVCTDDSCVPATGCVNTNNVAPCDDLNACTTGDTCAAGICVGGAPPNCDDLNVCTDDTCDIFTGCVNTPNDLNNPSDGMFCNGVETCSAGVIVPGTPPNCNDLNPCTDDACDEINDVCTNIANDANNPDDGLFCNGTDTCVAGVIVPGTPPNCNDANVCTDDSCDEVNDVCVNANNTAICDDGNACTEFDTCAAGVCTGSPIAGCTPCVADPDCDDLDPCTDDACFPPGVCVHFDNTAPCDDGDLCTANDTCSAGLCAGAAVDCTAAGNACNVGVCNPLSGVCEPSPANEGGPCDDGDPCTPNDICTLGTCTPGTAIDCSGLNNQCNVGVCNSVSGLCEAVPANEGAPCNDGSICTDTDLCVSGTCTGTPVPGCQECTGPLDCDDLDPCTDDSCHVAGFCVHTNNTAPCDDSNPCTGSDTCSAGTCAGTPISGCQNCVIAADCDDLNPCTDEACPAGVCVITNNTLPCDDADPCTSSDTCGAGACAGTPIPGCQTCVIPADCNDGNPCTDESCPAGVCVFTDNTAFCDDVNPCTSNDTCAAGVCAGTPIPGCLTCGVDADCDDLDPCTDDTCSFGVCVFLNNVAPCDDADPCTQNDTCAAGVCAGTAVDCSAVSDACNVGLCNAVTGVCEPSPINEGGLCDDNNLCTTGDLCVVGVCTGSAVDCSAFNDQCNVGTCDLVTGACQPTPTNEGAACNDQNACTTGDVCTAGVCAGTQTPGCQPCVTNPDCDDADPCTDDTCVSPGVCVHFNNTGPCDDADPCTQNDTCAAGVCAGSPVDCSAAGNACNVGTCNPVTGVCEPVPTNEGGPCDDANPCTNGDTCVVGTCTPGLPTDCTSLDNPCNVGVCNTTTGACEAQPTNEGIACDDGSVCTQTDVCVAGTCTGTPILGCQECTIAAECDDADPCTNDSCIPPGVCVHSNNTAPCDDANPCTNNDVCAMGACAGMPIPGCLNCVIAADCNDGNPCTDESCPAGACVFTNNTALCDDLDPCTSGDTCGGGLCAGTQIPGCLTCVLPTDCDDANPCTDDTCPAGVCVHTNNTLPCDDGLFCTDFDTCSAGVCIGTPVSNCMKCADATQCDDGNPCTDNLCPAGLCVFVDNVAPCDDGDPCTATDVCFAGACAGTPVDCTPVADACNIGVCNPVTGVCEPSPVNEGGPCDDTDPCTTLDTCAAGACAGTPVDCSILNDICVVGVCNAVNGLCETAPANEGGACNDGDACTNADVCVAGVCAGTPVPGCQSCVIDVDCTDGNPCTDDTCFPPGVCVHFDNLLPCDDADLCTLNDTCAGGVCAGSPVDCSVVADDCNIGVCNPVDGTCVPQPANEGGPCNDGDPCTLTGVCTAGACVAPPVDCSAAGDVCNVGVCNAATGVCEPQPANEGGLCDDANVCTQNDVCVAGTCTGTPVAGCMQCVVAADCDDADPCTDDTCVPPGICVHANNTAPCDDANPCTNMDTCAADVCAGTPIPGCLNCTLPADCNDGNPCTDDTCPAGACVFTNNTAACDDLDPCTNMDTCAVGACAGTPIPGCLNCVLPTDCNDGNPCTDDTCPAGVCVFTDNTLPCDDGMQCTANDTCSAGVCIGTPIGGCLKCLTAAECDDLDPCTDDTCPAGVCVNTPNTAPCDDLDPCTELDACALGVCAGSPIPGCQNCTVSGDCNDANACTSDICPAGVCLFVDTTPVDQCCDPLTGGLVPLDDLNACTTDVCNPDGTVTHTDTTPVGQCCDPVTGNQTPIDDADACTADSCNPDGTVTHADTTPAGFCCDPATGNLIPVDDGNACTIDTCNAADGSVTHNDTTPTGQCCNPIAGTLIPIDDGDACTVDVCNPTGTVTHTDTTPVGQCCDPVTGALIPINDNNACTTDICNTNGTVTHTDTTPIGQCCSPTTGGLTVIDDVNECTNDTCNLDGSVNHNDTTPPGFCCDPLTGGIAPIDDNNTCTIDLCNADGTVSHFNNPGLCDDGDICTVNDICLNGVCQGVVVDPLCTPTLDLAVAAAPLPQGPGTCFGVGDLITVSILMGPSTPVIVGGQFFLEFDTNTLDVVSIVPGDPPFTSQIFNVVDEAAGTIDYAIGAPPGQGSNLPATLAVITFQAVAECDSFIRFRPHTPPTILTDQNGFPRDPILGTPSVFTINNSAPVFTGCPTQLVVNADAGTFGAGVSWNPITATDSCDGPTTVSCDAVSGSVFPIGTTVVTCQSTNACGAIGTCAFDVIVRPFSTMIVSVQLSPTVVAGPLTRCITFELFQCGFIQQTVRQEIVFTNGLAFEVPVEVPAGFYECVTAQDALHTLRTTSADFTDDGSNFSATFVGDINFGGHGLTGGNLNNDEVVDIIDFSIWSSNFGVSFADTDCTLLPPLQHADINGDGIVNGFDFTFIAQHFLEFSQPNCCDVGALPGGSGPRLSISVDELQQRGLGHLADTDYNNDGVVDLADIELFIDRIPGLREQVGDVLPLLRDRN
ncbi:MAG: hypothetical protein ACE5EX_00010 [Phycisphaerae bacterium]